MMSDNLAGWSRQFYREPDGNPFLFYVVFWGFSQIPALSQQDYRSNGVFPGLQVSHFDKKPPEVLDGRRQGHLCDQLNQQKPALAEAVQEAGECHGNRRKIGFLSERVGRRRDGSLK